MFPFCLTERLLIKVIVEELIKSGLYYFNDVIDVIEK